MNITNCVVAFISLVADIGISDVTIKGQCSKQVNVLLNIPTLPNCCKFSLAILNYVVGSCEMYSKASISREMWKNAIWIVISTV